jgi:imidazolonepropionase-like amidohydrolase
MKTPVLVGLAILLVGCATSGSGQKSTGDPVPPDYRVSPQAGTPPLNFAPTSVNPENVVLKGATVMPASGPAIENGWIWIRNGEIVAVGSGPLEVSVVGEDGESATSAIPDSVAVIDVTGKFVTPGIIDTHSHLGVYPSPWAAAHSDGNEATSPTTPDVRAEHGLWPQDPGFERALAGGVTTQQVIPGSANLIGGRGITVKSHPGISSRAMQFPGAPYGLKMACGENPKRVYGSRNTKPSTRMGNMAVWRATWAKAVEYQRKLEKFEKAYLRWEFTGSVAKDEPEPPARDIGMETLVAVLNQEILVHVHCYRADEMLQVLQLADEFGFRIRSFHHAVEAYKIRDVLAEWNVGVSTWADWWGFKMEAHDAVIQNAGLLAQDGVPTIIHSDSAIGMQRLNQEAAKAYYTALRDGIEISEEMALKWITLTPAWALGVEGRTGSLEAGKMADVVVWSGHPFSVYSRPELVFVDGVREFDAAETSSGWSDFEVFQLPGQEAK